MALSLDFWPGLSRLVQESIVGSEWSGAEDKDDSQLKTLAAGLDRLGSALRPLGFTLAYHREQVPEKGRSQAVGPADIHRLDANASIACSQRGDAFSAF